MSFDVAAEAYDRFMGRYSRLLAPTLADLAGVRPGQRVLDVGSGPGSLTGELVRRLGADMVSAVDPSAPFVAAVRQRYPGVHVESATAAALPFPEGSFDVSLAQLVVHFLPDPLAGLVEMRRVTRVGGTVAACVWDHGGGRGPLGLFWAAVRALDPGAHDESGMPGVREGHLVELFRAAGLRDVRAAVLDADLQHETFEAWWEPFEQGVGPAGAYVGSLTPEARATLRDRCRARLRPEPFVIPARAWAAIGVA